MFDDPGDWVEKVIGNLSPFYWSIRSIIGLEMGVTILLSVVLAGAFVFVTSQARATRFDRPARRALLRGALSSHQVRVFALILLAFSVQLSTYIVTGYFNKRG